MLAEPPPKFVTALGNSLALVRKFHKMSTSQLPWILKWLANVIGEASKQGVLRETRTIKRNDSRDYGTSATCCETLIQGAFLSAYDPFPEAKRAMSEGRKPPERSLSFSIKSPG